MAKRKKMPKVPMHQVLGLPAHQCTELKYEPVPFAQALRDTWRALGQPFADGFVANARVRMTPGAARGGVFSGGPPVSDNLPRYLGDADELEYRTQRMPRSAIDFARGFGATVTGRITSRDAARSNGPRDGLDALTSSMHSASDQIALYLSMFGGTSRAMADVRSIRHEGAVQASEFNDLEARALAGLVAERGSRVADAVFGIEASGVRPENQVVIVSGRHRAGALQWLTSDVLEHKYMVDLDYTQPAMSNNKSRNPMSPSGGRQYLTKHKRGRN